MHKRSSRASVTAGQALELSAGTLILNILRKVILDSGEYVFGQDSGRSMILVRMCQGPEVFADT